MKPIRILLVAAVMIVLSACQNKPAESPVKTITVKYINWDRTTLFRITCETFDKYFPEATVKTISQQGKIDSVINLLNNMKSTDPGNTPDIRGRMFITHVNKVTDTVCLGAEFLLYKNGTYETPPQLLNLIQE